MLRRHLPVLLAGLGALALGAMGATPARAQYPGAPPAPQLNRFFYYPHSYFPHSYWPSQGPIWPEPAGAGYQRPPAYMAYPPFRHPGWRYEWWEPQHYYRGFHFWLDQF